ncbi:acyl-ACP--UDP-N-acetylglucosamine O-acyltransferase [Holospora curviuscula]|uniref:Acyl-[acyl-carrier-protein]--UDP-N-acetylglucosamine O-acyltransferase n=1 Tax=Holospora curviuscula TaxID=1082868 RepID=A0A2S5R7J4_9PROT|nr:acyl-ACP--UDP-N-acetylglucosamine O-acyltransferase [Holospora curviuscula]PPE03263.1 Acyl-[acyl-carrier-protein]--UDP-N-acetylglucosamine O-acyltransferase [Holospora curviuscula]
MTIHVTALVDSNAVVHPTAIVGPYCVVGAGSILEAGVHLMSHVVIEGNTHLQEGVRVHAFSVLGTAPQHTGYNNELTRLVIGRNTQIREHVTVHRGTKQGGGITSIGTSCMIMVGCHIGHDGQIGNDVIMANNVVLGGHVEVEDSVVFGGMVAVHQMTAIGKGSMIAGCSAVGSHITPYTIAVGNRAKLAGLNLHRLKKKKVSSEEIHGLREVYQYLFKGENQLSLEFRIHNIAQGLMHYETVQEVYRFLSTCNKNRPICLSTPDKYIQEALKITL